MSSLGDNVDSGIEDKLGCGVGFREIERVKEESRAWNATGNGTDFFSLRLAH
jgi:hypothetical protein